MMTIPFRPDGLAPFSFQATVGGVMLFCTVPFSIYANRYYLKINDSAGSTVAYIPLIASPDNFDINLALSYAPGMLIYRGSSRQFEVS